MALRHRLFLGILAWAAAGGSARAAIIPDAAQPSLVVGANGLGVAAYYDRVNGDLMVARCLDAACTAITTSVVDSGGDVGRYASMTPGTSATLGPVITYEDTTNHRLKLAFCVDPACAAATTVVVAPDIGTAHGSAVALGIDGRPLVAYLRSQTKPFGSFGLAVAHCDDAGCASVTTTPLSSALVDEGDVDIAIGPDGLAVIAYTHPGQLHGPFANLLHCASVACTGAGFSEAAHGAEATNGLFARSAHPAVDARPGGLPAFSNTTEDVFPSPRAAVRRCQSASCRTSTTQFVPDVAYEHLDLAVGADDRVRLVVRQASAPGLDFVRCLDAECATRERTCLAGLGTEPSLVVDGAGQALAAYEIGEAIAVATPTGSCGTVLAITGGARAEDAGSPLAFTVRVGPPQPTAVTVQYATVDGTAVAGADYVAASGTITFPPGSTEQTVAVEILSDLVDESDEAFSLVLSNAVGAAIVAGTGVGTILDDDVLPSLDVLDCAAVETNGVGASCLVEARLSGPYPEPVTVQYATANGTATAGSDYGAVSGVMTFAPGSVSGTVSVPVVGDVTPEPDEAFTVSLSAPANATLGDASADGVIVDDDGTPAGDRELIAGTTVTADLAADPGPAADRDDYRIAQAPYASYEVVLDAASGDAAPDVRLDRIASDGSTVLQAAPPVGTGTARSLRFQNRLGVAVVGQSIRVGSAACGTACGVDDVYRLRAYETTATIPRFNNSPSQATVVVVQNTSEVTVAANVDFWSTSGTLLATAPLTLAPRGLGVVSVPSIPALSGQSGSITITNDGAYGVLAGKAVALEPASGFSFDTPLVYRPR